MNYGDTYNTILSVLNNTKSYDFETLYYVILRINSKNNQLELLLIYRQKYFFVAIFSFPLGL